jgi:hypothetical protein
VLSRQATSQRLLLPVIGLKGDAEPPLDSSPATLLPQTQTGFQAASRMLADSLMFMSCRHLEFGIFRLTSPPTSTFVTIKLFVPYEPLPPRPTSAIATTSSQPTFSCIQSRLLEPRTPGESTRPIGPPPSLIDQAINVHLTSAARRPKASARSGFAALPDDRALHTTYLSLSLAPARPLTSG